jgi:hypothetical protein
MNYHINCNCFICILNKINKYIAIFLCGIYRAIFLLATDYAQPNLINTSFYNNMCIYTTVLKKKFYTFSFYKAFKHSRLQLLRPWHRLTLTFKTNFLFTKVFSVPYGCTALFFGIQPKNKIYKQFKPSYLFSFQSL